MSTESNNPRVVTAVWRLGTIGFAYDDWAGPFYPDGLKADRRLGWYAKRFGTIELDTTFYATPRAEVVKRWAAATPDGFRFAVKAPREVTHDPGLAELADARPRQTVDLLLLALAQAELKSEGMKRTVYENEREREWSGFLGNALKILEQLTHEMEDDAEDL